MSSAKSNPKKLKSLPSAEKKKDLFPLTVLILPVVQLSPLSPLIKLDLDRRIAAKKNCNHIMYNWEF